MARTYVKFRLLCGMAELPDNGAHYPRALLEYDSSLPCTSGDGLFDQFLSMPAEVLGRACQSDYHALEYAGRLSHALLGAWLIEDRLFSGSRVIESYVYPDQLQPIYDSLDSRLKYLATLDGLYDSDIAALKAVRDDARRHVLVEKVQSDLEQLHRMNQSTEDLIADAQTATREILDATRTNPPSNTY